MSNQHSVAASSVTVTTTTETVLATIGPVNINEPGGQGVAFDGNINITAGTGTTSVTMRVRRGTDATGTLVGSAQSQTVTAGNTVNVPIAELDTSTSLTNTSWVVTIQQTAATANGTVNRVVFSALDAAAFE